LWRMTMIPQIVFILLTCISLAAITCYGMCIAIKRVQGQDSSEADTLQKTIPMFIGGSSSVLGFVVLRLFAKLSEVSRDFIHGEYRFTAQIAAINGSNTKEEFSKAVSEYGKK